MTAIPSPPDLPTAPQPPHQHAMSCAPESRVLPIVQYPDPALRRVCAGLPPDPAALARDMLATMYAAPGRGLAAPQLGLTWRMFVMDVDWKDGTPAPLVALDPAITDPSEARVTRTEGCLSIPDTPAEVSRPAEVTLHWTDLVGNRRSQRLSGIAATCAQHEMDHLDGILILDRAIAADAEAAS